MDGDSWIIPANYLVVNKEGLNVRAQTNTQSTKNILRWMSNGEGFHVYQIIKVKGSTGIQEWGRITDNPGGLTQEYVCLGIGNRRYALPSLHNPIPTPDPDDNQIMNWVRDVDGYLRTLGYTGALPE